MGERKPHRVTRHALATYAYFGCSLLLLNYRMDFTERPQHPRALGRRRGHRQKMERRSRRKVRTAVEQVQFGLARLKS